RFPHCTARALHQRCHLNRRQPAPWRTKHREPGNAVTRMRQGACQCIEVLHDLLFTEPLDFHCPIAQACNFQRGHDMVEMTTIAPCERKFVVRSNRSKGTPPSPKWRARRKSATSASRKR